MNVPGWYGLVLLALAAWRTFHLVAHDDILDTPRRRLLRLAKTWKQEGDATGPGYREKWAAFITCPYCCGFWLSLGIYLLWIWFPTETLAVCVPLALNAGVIGAQRILSSE